ncbi:hypothetical protein CANCADRAFT_25863 [Tortispora caseinolytica NRRL Y-17796]|uniref:Autophagy-related protein 3 n=1 Tax=Tortispora caseinolytica NRRL Y-17796 TaxID=767744 RepID=A0A1E4TE17_9ASCO|nr:hypothetical protein CANCADRAFT_25863 [Tortispora caseinolytica NRRL Y-17796]
MLGIRSKISALREYLTPVSTVSTYQKTGEITPEEFVAAGDFLVYKFPTWEWFDVTASRRREFLPEDKQVLITRLVPSYIRANNDEGNKLAEALLGDDTLGAEDDGGWTEIESAIKSKAAAADDKRNDAIADMEAVDADDLDDFDAAEPAESSSDHDPSQKRTYNLYITYSLSYRVPKMYLSGFNADGVPLSADEMAEDIIGEYKDKTVTIEKAPFMEDQTMISIHPCKHANVMRVLLGKAEDKFIESQKPEEITEGMKNLSVGEDNEWEQIDDSHAESAVPVTHYMIYFLKFISSVTPGIEHDYTMGAL